MSKEEMRGLLRQLPAGSVSRLARGDARDYWQATAPGRLDMQSAYERTTPDSGAGGHFIRHNPGG